MNSPYIHSISNNEIIMDDKEFGIYSSVGDGDVRFVRGDEEDIENEYENIGNNNNNNKNSSTTINYNINFYNKEDFESLYIKVKQEKKPFHEIIKYKSGLEYSNKYIKIIKWFENTFIYKQSLEPINMYGKTYIYQEFIGYENIIGELFPKYRVICKFENGDQKIIKCSNNKTEVVFYFHHLISLFKGMHRELSIEYQSPTLTDSLNILNNEEIKKITRTRIALIIGNSNYESGSKLPGVVKDLQSIYQTLISCSFINDNIIYIQDTKLGNFIKKWNEFLENLGQYQTYLEVVIYYAGHGISKEGRLDLVMIDGTDKVQLSSLISGLTQTIRNPDSLCLFIIDCCREINHDNIESFINPMETFDDKKNISILFACKYGELSYESNEKDLEIGIFTNSLVKTINNRKGKDLLEISKFVNVDIQKLQSNYKGCSLFGNFNCLNFKFN